MIKKYTPKIIIKYLIKEFCKSLAIFFSIFFSLIILINYIEEIIFFKVQKNSGNLFFETLHLSIIKSPTILINMLPFIFLFSGIFFFAKLVKNNEISPLSLSGFSQKYISLIPAIFSFFIGIIIIIVLTPISSSLSKYYESVKQKYYLNDNLIIMSSTGLWVKEKKNNFNYIIRADKIENTDFSILSNVTIYKFDSSNKLINRVDGKSALINDKIWTIKNAIISGDNINMKYKEIIYETNIDLLKLKSLFINPNIFSIWNINEQILQVKKIGYYGQELIITLHKYISTPFVLFSMIIISTIFTLQSNFRFNNYIYSFLGILVGIIFYFLSDLSIALGKSGKIPLIFSVWIPIITIVIVSFFSLTRRDL